MSLNKTLEFINMDNEKHTNKEENQKNDNFKWENNDLSKNNISKIDLSAIDNLKPDTNKSKHIVKKVIFEDCNFLNDSCPAKFHEDVVHKSFDVVHKSLDEEEKEQLKREYCDPNSSLSKLFNIVCHVKDIIIYTVIFYLVNNLINDNTLLIIKNKNIIPNIIIDYFKNLKIYFLTLTFFFTCVLIKYKLL